MQRTRNAIKVANSKSKQLRTQAATKALDLMNQVVTNSQSGVVDVGLNVGSKIVTPIVRYHVSFNPFFPLNLTQLLLYTY